MNPLPKFLTVDQVVALHKLQIEQFGGIHGVKDEGLLLSTLAQPESGFGDQYFHRDLYEMAAAYLLHLVKNHAFHDGNKRIAALASAVFLEVNGLEVTADEDEFEKFVLDAAQSLVTKDQIADFFRSNTSAHPTI
jgi:death on curing protein